MKSLHQLAIGAAALLITHGAVAADPQPPRFAVRVLVENAGPYTYPQAFNNDLQVTTAYYPDHPIPLYAEDHFVDFNNKGERLGWSYRDCCEYDVRHYYVRRAASVNWLDGLVEANAINDDSVVAGAYLSGGGNRRAVLFDGAVYRDLGTLGGAESSATDVNNRGDAIGWSLTADGENHPFLYRDGAMQDLAQVPGWIGMPDAINDLGQIVASYREADDTRRIRFYADGQWQELAAGRGVFFNDLNNLGQVLLYLADEPVQTSTRFWQDGQAYNLFDLVDPSARYRFSPAVDINDRGEILLRGCSLTDQDQCSILMLQPIPEPRVWAMMVLGLAWFCFRRPRPL